MADADDVRDLAMALPHETEKQAFLLGEPDLFFTAPGYDGWPLVMLRLDQVDVDRLAELLTDSWRMRAPEPL